MSTTTTSTLSLSLLFLSTFLFLFSPAHPVSLNPSSLSSAAQSELWTSNNGGRTAVPARKERVLAVGPTTANSTNANSSSSSLVLAAKRTRRRDPLDGFRLYTGGWNISELHYWASVGFTAAPFFAIAALWFVLFGLCLVTICLCRLCCSRVPYGYSRLAYALSLIFLILFTIASIVGCVVLYTSQGRFHHITTTTLNYGIKKADDTVLKLRNVSGYLSDAKKIGVNSAFLSSSVQTDIDEIMAKINSSAAMLSDKALDNASNIQGVLDSVRLALIIVAAVMLFLTFLGFLFSVFGLQVLVYTLVMFGWILVAGTFILCGIFLLLHNVAADACVAMDQWVLNPTAHTALDDILPCVDNATSQETLLRSKEVTYQLVELVNQVLGNVSNVNFPPGFEPLYYNQSGPKVPLLCNPFDATLANRTCSSGQVSLSNATKVWKGYVCEVSSSGICTTTGRLTPTYYNQMSSSVNVSYGLYEYGPFLVDLEDCTFVRDTFTVVSDDYCSGLRRYSKLVYVGLVMVSAAVMLSLVFWVIYGRERKHRAYTKHVHEEEDRKAS